MAMWIGVLIVCQRRVYVFYIQNVRISKIAAYWPVQICLAIHVLAHINIWRLIINVCPVSIFTFYHFFYSMFPFYSHILLFIYTSIRSTYVTSYPKWEEWKKTNYMQFCLVIVRTRNGRSLHIYVYMYVLCLCMLKCILQSQQSDDVHLLTKQALLKLD